MALTYAGASPFKPAYLVPQANFTGDIPNYEYALYEGRLAMESRRAGRVAGRARRTKVPAHAERYTSHNQTPFDHVTGFTAMARSGRVGLVAFPLGTSYYRHGYWVYRAAFQHLLDAVLPVRLLQTNAPLSTEITVTHQPAQRRYLIHVVNFSPLRKAPPHPEFHEDPIPLSDVTVRLNLPLKVSGARALVAGTELPVRSDRRGVEVTLRRVPVSEVVCLEQE